MGDLEFVKYENNVTMSRDRRSLSRTPFEIHQVSSIRKVRHNDSPTSSILKTPTAIFVTTRNSSAKTKKLKFANGPVDLQTLRNGSHESSVSVDSSEELVEDRKSSNNGEIVSENNIIEVAISPVKTMQVSPESWKAFLAYKKYGDYSNETEKTDYTYSRLSKYRNKEIIPEFPARPNLCRSSLYSRRLSSISLPGSQSSLNDSYLSGYDFKVHSESNSEINNDYKTPSQAIKFSRSKYYLRSSSFDGTETGEAEFKSPYLEDYLNNSAPEHFSKTTTTYTTSANPKYNYNYLSSNIRSMDLDDEDIDEVDVDNSVRFGKQYQSSAWSQNKPQTLSDNMKNFFTAIFLYLTSVGTITKNGFSKYILRKQEDPSYYSSGDSSRYDKMSYATAGGSWTPWTNEKSYYSPEYYSSYSGGYYGRQRSWYETITGYFSDRFYQIRNLLWGSNAGYGAYRYQDTSRRRKLWWLLIPLLLLAGLCLYRAEQENGFVSHHYKDWDCRTGGLFTATENAIKRTWRWIYIAYKRAEASASCYVNDSWERLKLPFTHISELLRSKFSFPNPFAFLFGIIDTLWQGLRNIISLSRDAFSNMCFFLFDFFTDFLSAVGNVLQYVYRYFTDLFLIIANGFIWALGSSWTSLTNTFKSSVSVPTFTSKSDFEYKYDGPDSSGAACLRQQKSIDKLTHDMEDFKSITWDLSAIKKKIDDLELEFRREKESRKNQNEMYDRQLEENHKKLQKYQATVNHVLTSSKRPARLAAPSIQYFLDNQSDGLKQWITQNFLLKSDSSDIDEDKLGYLIAKYSNKTGDDLLVLKEEFKRFVLNHKSEMEAMRNDLNNLGGNSLGGGDVSVAYIKKLIADAIKLYDADKTGRVDYALETAGGQVYSIRCTETYIARPKSYVLLGWAVYTKTSSPRDAISPGMAAGQCWAFVGSQGFLVLQLSHTIKVTGFTMEHISRSLVPKGHIESAPKNFSMWGLRNENDMDPYLFGEYMYVDNDETLQYFPVTYATPERYNFVELKITSNHGNPNYTCLYRIRVHGDPHPLLE